MFYDGNNRTTLRSSLQFDRGPHSARSTDKKKFKKRLDMICRPDRNAVIRLNYHAMITNNAVSQPRIRGRSRPFRSLLVAVTGAVILTGGIVPRADAVLVTYFNFNDAAGVGSPTDLSSDAPGVQASTLVVAGETNTAQTGINLNIAAGDPELFGLGMGFSDSEQLNTATMTFSVNTLGLTNLSLSFATTEFNNGGYTLATGSFSINGGATFLTTGVSAPVVLNGANQLVTFTYPITVNNLASVLFRVTLSGAPDNEGIPSLRTTVDNIQLNAVPEPATVMGGLLGACGLCWHQRRRLIRFLRLRPA
jgi:hypothetical protein